jgi:hypothetical protein
VVRLGCSLSADKKAAIISVPSMCKTCGRQAPAAILGSRLLMSNQASGGYAANSCDIAGGATWGDAGYCAYSSGTVVLCANTQVGPPGGDADKATSS